MTLFFQLIAPHSETRHEYTRSYLSAFPTRTITCTYIRYHTSSCKIRPSIPISLYAAQSRRRVWEGCLVMGCTGFYSTFVLSLRLSCIYSSFTSGYIQPTLDKLSVLHNFTIESQVQLHAPLAFLPTTIAHNSSQAFGLTPEDLTVFVNSAEWTLCMWSVPWFGDVLTFSKHLVCQTIPSYILWSLYHPWTTVPFICWIMRVRALLSGFMQ